MELNTLELQFFFLMLLLSGITFLVSFLDCLLLVYRKYFEFHPGFSQNSSLAPQVLG